MTDCNYLEKMALYSQTFPPLNILEAEGVGYQVPSEVTPEETLNENLSVIGLQLT